MARVVLEAARMDIAVFAPHELPIVLGAIRGIDPQPTRLQDDFLELIARLHGEDLRARCLPAPTPLQTKAAVTDPHKRKRLLQLAIVMSTIDGSVEREPATGVARLAEALGVDERGVGTLKKIAAHHDTLARFDMMRQIGGRLVGDAWRDERWSGVRKVLAGTLGTGVEDDALTRRYNRIGLCPEGSFGRALWEHWVTRDFALPGQRNAIPEIGVFHDLGHVLSGYDTDPDGELQQGAFQAGFVRKAGFMFLFFVIAQFHLGMKFTPVADAEIGRLDIEKLVVALARGAACKVDLSDGWDFWPDLTRPLADVRAELGIPALS